MPSIPCAVVILALDGSVGAIHQISIAMPGERPLSLGHAVFDFNGTLAANGELSGTIRDRLTQLGEIISISVLTADTFGSARRNLENLPLSLHIVESGDDKREFIKKLGEVETVAVGNGRNDVGMLQEANLGIAVMGSEGVCSELLAISDILVGDIQDALDLLLEPKKLIATLRR